MQHNEHQLFSINCIYLIRRWIKISIDLITSHFRYSSYRSFFVFGLLPPPSPLPPLFLYAFLPLYENFEMLLWNKTLTENCHTHHQTLPHFMNIVSAAQYFGIISFPAFMWHVLLLLWVEKVYRRNLSRQKIRGWKSFYKNLSKIELSKFSVFWFNLDLGVHFFRFLFTVNPRCTTKNLT